MASNDTKVMEQPSTEKKSQSTESHKSTAKVSGRLPSFVLCGNYGAGNLGDELMLQGILYALSRVSPGARVCVLAHNPGMAAEHKEAGNLLVEYRYLFPFGVRSWVRGLLGGELFKTLRAMRKSSVFILGGGGLINDETFMSLIIWGGHVALAKLLNLRVVFWGVSVGPLKSSFGQKAARFILKKVDLAMVRDKSSMGYFETLKGWKGELLQGTDPLFHWPEAKFYWPQAKAGEAKMPGKKHLIFTFRKWPSIDQNTITFFAQLWDEAIGKYGITVCFLAFQKEYGSDEAILNTIFEQMKEKQAVRVVIWESPKQVMDLYREADAVFGMRLHSLLLAAYLKKPFFGLAYTDKVFGLFGQDFGGQICDPTDREGIKRGLVHLVSHHSVIADGAESLQSCFQRGKDMERHISALTINL